MLLKQVGSTNGDKHLLGEISNMKLGEYRYYPQDNKNLIRAPRKLLTRKAFFRLLNKYFPEYTIDSDMSGIQENEKKLYVRSIGMMENIRGEQYYMPKVINKGYVCFKEATPLEDGTVLYIHSGFVMAYKERYKDQ